MRRIYTMSGAKMDAKALYWYLRNLVNRFFKILPMRESKETSLVEYMKSLQLELIGCSELVIVIHWDPDYVTLLSILQYLINNPEAPVHVFKREVFKAITICNKLKARYAALEGEG